jgi:endonuclease/exonuclease/phosphatase family metal-dependent hydrolase
MLIDGNDPRGINCALMAREGFPIAAMRSHVDAADGKGLIFRRDCPEYHLDTPSGRLVVMVNHFKSKAGGRRSSDLRRREAAEAARIYRDLRGAGEAMVAVVGDLNDTPPGDDPRHPLFELVGNTDLLDVSALDGHDNGGHPGTYRLARPADKIDYILLSPALRERAGASGVFRRGVWPGERARKWPVFPEIDPAKGGDERRAASDHAALWVDLDL